MHNKLAAQRTWRIQTFRHLLLRMNFRMLRRPRIIVMLGKKMKRWEALTPQLESPRIHSLFPTRKPSNELKEKTEKLDLKVDSMWDEQEKSKTDITKIKEEQNLMKELIINIELAILRNQGRIMGVEDTVALLREQLCSNLANPSLPLAVTNYKRKREGEIVGVGGGKRPRRSSI